jgi:glycosyltransferase involved in cell wall biosynthesis
LKDDPSSYSYSQESHKGRSTVLLIDNDGFSYYTCYLARGLTKFLDVVLFSFSEESFVTTGASREKGIKFYDIKKRLPKGSSTARGIIRVFLLFFILLSALTKTKYDIVHIQDFLPAFFLFVPFLKLRRKHICWTLHDVEIFNFSTGLNGKLHVLFLKLVAQPRLMSIYADKIFVHSLSLREQLIVKKVDENKIHVIRFFDYRYLLEIDSHDKKLKYDDFMLNGSYILFFGNIAPWKGIDTLINAIKVARNKLGYKFTVVIAGEPYEGLKHIQFFKNANNEDLKIIKIINRFITSSEIPSLVSKCSFLVLPYNDLFQHSASGVIPLAYTFSKPVIVSNIPSLVEYVEQDKTGLIFEVNDSKQLANYMIELIENDHKCKRMGEEAHQKVLNEMSLDICCTIINNIYKSLASKNEL